MKQPEGALSKDDQAIHRLRQIVLDNLSNEQFGVEELAQSYGISRSQLHRKLKKLRKQSISQFIREIRLDKAHKMLQEDLGTVSEIAYRVGFNSPTYFNTTFRNHFGYPPGEAKIRSVDESSGRPRFQSVNPDAKKERPKRLRTFAWIGVGALIILLVSIIYKSKDQDQPSLIESEIPMRNGISIAILPLENWSGNSELDYVSYGITDAVITKLSHLQSIDRLIPFKTILGYANSDLSLKEIANELSVKYLIEGNYQVSGNMVKVKIQLVNPKLSKQLNINEYYGQWKEEELFLLQSNIAEGVVELLEVELSDNEFQLLNYVPTNNEMAYEAYLKGYYQTLKSNQEGFKNALPLFEEAIGLDPSFIEPYIEIVRIWMTSGMIWGITDQQIAWKNAKDIIIKALPFAVNQDHLQRLNGFLCRGQFYYEYNFQCIEEQYEKYISNEIDRLDPAIRIDYIRKTGRFQEGLSLVEDAIKSDPNMGSNYAAKAIALFFLDRNEEAYEFLQKSNNLFNDSYFYLMESAKLYYYLGEFDDMDRQFSSILKKFPDRPPLIKWFGLINAELKQDSETINQFKDQLHNDYNNKSPGSPAWFLALYYCHIKDYDTAFEWLQKSYDNHEVEMTWLKEEPLLRPLRSDPRYIDLYNKVGFPFPISETKDLKP